MLGTKILKENFNKELYKKCAIWCNENQGEIVEHKDYYEVVEHQLTTEELNNHKLQEMKRKLNDINYNIAIMQGISACGISVDGETEYDLLKDGELVTLSETEFNNYFDKLTDERSNIIMQIKTML